MISTLIAQQSRKRELTSPEFEADNKKNKVDLDASDFLPISEESEFVKQTMATGFTDEVSGSAPHLVIPPSEMLKLSEIVIASFQGEISNLVDSVVKGVLTGLQDRIISLEHDNTSLRADNKALQARVTTLESQADQSEQYSRRNCIRISGYREELHEDTDRIVLDMATKIGSDIDIRDIDRSHRIGNPTHPKRTKPRDIIVKFSTYRARAKFYSDRVKLKINGFLGVFVNEDLTKRRSSYLYQARLLVKSDRLKGAWSTDGTILIKDNTGNVHRINSLNDLVPYGYQPLASAGID